MKQEMKRGVSIFLFPEGTRNKSVQPLLPFHDGAFRIAIDLQKPIVPLVMLNTGSLIPAKWNLFKPGRVKCVFLDPIPTEGMTDENLVALKNRTFAMMEKVVVENDVRFGKDLGLQRA